MATHTPPAPPPPTDDYVAGTTRRGLATWSFAVGVWSCLVVWWYPYSLFVSSAGLVIGLIALVAGWRGGKDRENLALAGVVMCVITIGAALTFHRAMQLFFGDLSTPVAP
jgi:hypothetical protein